MASKKTSPFDSIESVIADFRKGKMIVVTDDENRENEGDIITSAEKITPEKINFMVKYGRGLVCVPITEKRAAQLDLKSMVLHNQDHYGTHFTVSVDATKGVTTGISAYDRAKTIQILANPKSKPSHLVQPGHIFPLQAKPGGVLQRTGHTEASADLARLAGLDESAVLCEILKDDGTMARLPDLLIFAKKHHLKIASIRDLIEYRRRNEKLVVCQEIIDMPTKYGDFKLHLYHSLIDNKHHIALVKGTITANDTPLVRVHSECLTGDLLGSMRCDCGTQLHDALTAISKEKCGALIYLRQEGRGIGFVDKIHAYKLQEMGLDTVEANLKLGHPADLREYGIGAQILLDIGIRKMRLLTNNPKKVIGLAGYDLTIVDQVPIRSTANPHNQRYLQTKKKKMGHLL